MIEGGRDYSTVEQWLGLGIQYGLSERVRLGVESAYGWVRARKLGSNQFDSGKSYPFKTNLIPAMAHLFLHLRKGGRVMPYLDFGAGAIYWEIRDLRNSGGTTFSNGRKVRSKISPAVSAGIGVDFLLSSRFAFTTKARYNRMIKGNEDTSGLLGFNNLPGDPNKAVAEVQFGFKLFFGGSADKDGDGLLNAEEKSYGTNPKHADSDLDGLDDYNEVHSYRTDPLKKDSDDDLINDAEEVNVFKTDPNSADTDQDGLDDGKEINFYETDPLLPDSDKDGLKDSEEINVYKTAPLKADSDGDGLTDGEEVKLLNSNPLDQDTDGDGIDDATEVNEHRTNPIKSDTDAGGVSDAVELARGTNPLDPNDDVSKKSLKRGPQILAGIEFASNSDQITPESEQILQEVLKAFLEFPEMHVVIHGYTDNTGSRDYNIRLSQRRAEAVQRYFILHGISPDRIKALGFGPDSPVASNATREGRQRNRRIEFVVVEE